jgi:hypothetical protein
MVVHPEGLNAGELARRRRLLSAGPTQGTSVVGGEQATFSFANAHGNQLRSFLKLRISNGIGLGSPSHE